MRYFVLAVQIRELQGFIWERVIGRNILEIKKEIRIRYGRGEEETTNSIINVRKRKIMGGSFLFPKRGEEETTNSIINVGKRKIVGAGFPFP